MLEFGMDTFLIGEEAPFLIKAEEGENNCVRFVVSLSCRGEQGECESHLDNDVLKHTLSNVVPLHPKEENTYEIIFENYILYQIRNESYCSWDDYEIRKGSYFIVFERSRLLDILPQMTDSQVCKDGSYYPGAWKHYGVYCQNHIIDIVSHNEPMVCRVNSML